MGISIFYTTFCFIVLIPTFLGFFVFKNNPLIVIPSILLLVSLASNLLLKWRASKGFKPSFIFLLVVYLFYSSLRLNLNNLPENLFGLSQLFVAYLIWWENNFRKFFYITLLSFLNLTIVSLYFQALLYGAVLAIYLFLTLLFFLLLAAEVYKKEDKKLVIYLFKYSLFVYLTVFLFGTVLFFVLPRPVKPIFTLIHKEKPKPAIGFSNKIQLGEFNNVASDTSVVFRAKLNVKPKELYWRGNTLETFDGKNWSSLNEPYAETEFKKGSAKRFTETLLISPYGDKNVFTFGYPSKVLESSLEGLKVDSSKNVIFAGKEIVKPIKVKILATNPQNVKVKLLKKEKLLFIPPTTRELIAKVVKNYHLKGQTFYQTRLKLEKFFQQFKYNISNRAKNLAEFLDLYKEGNCEYFASAAALIFRYLGYPSRVVVGFYGGDFNPVTGYYVVRQQNAHAWVEVFYKNRWWRFDGTKYALVGEEIKSQVQVHYFEKNKLAVFWDTLNTLWFEYVVNLNQEKQVKLLNKVREGFTTLKTRLEENLPSIVRFSLALFLIAALVYYKRFLFWLFKLFLFLKRELPLNKLGSSIIELYNYLWENRPKIFARYKKILKFFVKSSLPKGATGEVSK